MTTYQFYTLTPKKTMQGIHVINDPNGNPAVLTIDLHALDPDVSPLVAGLLDRLAQ